MIDETKEYLIQSFGEPRDKEALDSYIEIASNEEQDCGIYTERHHVIPKCSAPAVPNEVINSPENIVRLSAYNHCLAHVLIAQAFPENWKLSYAASQMLRGNRLDNMSCGEVKELLPSIAEARESAMEGRGNDEAWRENTARGIEKRTSDPVWRENTARGIEKRTSDPVWRENKARANRELAKDPVWRENHARAYRDPINRVSISVGQLTFSLDEISRILYYHFIKMYYVKDIAKLLDKPWQTINNITTGNNLSILTGLKKGSPWSTRCQQAIDFLGFYCTELENL